jgi:hypothetical protein
LAPQILTSFNPRQITTRLKSVAISCQPIWRRDHQNHAACKKKAPPGGIWIPTEAAITLGGILGRAVPYCTVRAHGAKGEGKIS